LLRRLLRLADGEGPKRQKAHGADSPLAVAGGALSLSHEALPACTKTAIDSVSKHGMAH
jgi:hypothetical protein